MKGKRTIVGALFIAAGLAALWWLTPPTSEFKQAITWQRLASPGPLSTAHASLETSCAVCHTAVKGVEANNCIMCHANNESLLQRQPTAFHANVGSCSECHREHQGRDRRPTKMDHSALARIGLRQLEQAASSLPPAAADEESGPIRDQLVMWIKHQAVGDYPIVGNPRIRSEEAVLNCWNCHSNNDRHFQLFGRDCAQCHAATAWTIPEFRHPSPQSLDCAQCHQAPPSHYMEHFRMISMTVAHQPFAQANQCFLCHQTTSWNDIKGVGWYKHH